MIDRGFFRMRYWLAMRLFRVVEALLGVKIEVFRRGQVASALANTSDANKGSMGAFRVAIEDYRDWHVANVFHPWKVK